MHKAQTLNVPVLLNAQNYKQTSLQASPFVTPRFSPKRLAPESWDQSNWKYSCPSAKNQTSWTTAQTQRKKTSLYPRAPRRRRLSVESRETPYLRDRNQEGSNADHGEMRFANTTIREIKTSCTSELHCKFRHLFQRQKANV